MTVTTGHSLVDDTDPESTRGAERQVAREGWWNNAFGVFQTNLREVDVTLDVEATLDDIEAHGATVWLLNVGGILAHHPTDLDFQPRNPELRNRPGGDLVGDAVAAARRRGIRLLARMDFSKITAEVANKHPDWAYRSRTGGLQIYEGLVSVCPSGRYYQERMFEIVDEVIDRYNVDGFFFNWFGFNEVDYGRTLHGVCHCDSCRSAFTAESGLDLPADADHPNYVAWKQFARRTIDELTARISAHIATRSPGAALILGRSADILFYEANNAVGRPLWPHATSEAVSASRVTQPEKPALVNAVAFLDMPYRLSDEQPEMLGQYLVQAIARGANPSTYIMGATRGILYDGLETAAIPTRTVTKNPDVYSGLSPCSPVALVQPDGLRVEPGRHAQARAEFTGWYVSLQEAHVPFDVLPADAITPKALAAFEAVVMPDIVSLEPAQDAAIDAYVAAGGHVVTSAGTGLEYATIERDAAASWLPAEYVTSVETADAELMSSYVKLDDLDHVEGASLIPRHGRAYRVAWRDGVESTFTLIERAPFGPPEKAYGHVLGSESAAARRPIGTGAVTQFTWTIGTTYGAFGLTRIRDAAVGVVRDALSTTMIEVDGPEYLEVVLGRSAAGLVIHLINHSGQRRNSYGPAAPIRDVRLRVPGGGSEAEVRSLVEPAGLTVEHDGDDVVLNIHAVDAFDVVVVGSPAARRTT
ncbi:alpha-amylase family protein [Microbacterium sp. MPKO10]|uniref:alpha-amylase family protein n=1 Tax=Microbacterium sp. MPKO10 TaxID=2989818 RepID=UPI002235CCDC|nr:alpha-amylase family protein [Microbacterium sp. MPKO10]MCW4459802.1 beta-galactosidase trimerization domain-containing protein [Microbacterium sp. MPKO10]